MTVDEAIGMYASDSEDDFNEPDENRRSKGDSVLGGATMEDSGYRSKGDSVLGGARSPQSMNRRSEHEVMLANEIDHKRISGDSVGSVGRGNEADAEGDLPESFRPNSQAKLQEHVVEVEPTSGKIQQHSIRMVSKELDVVSPMSPVEVAQPATFEPEPEQPPSHPELTYQSLIPPGDEDILPPHTPVQKPVAQPKRPAPVPVDRYGYAHSRT